MHFSGHHGHAAPEVNRLHRCDVRVGPHARHVGFIRLRHHRHSENLHVLPFLVSLRGKKLNNLLHFIANYSRLKVLNIEG